MGLLIKAEKVIMKMNTNELSGLLLDCEVARIRNPEWFDNGYMKGCDLFSLLTMDDGVVYSPSTSHEQAFIIVEEDGIDLWCNVPRSVAEKNAGWVSSWRACYHRCGVGTEPSFGETPMLAAMRAYVVKHAGASVEIPDCYATSVFAETA